MKLELTPPVRTALTEVLGSLRPMLMRVLGEDAEVLPLQQRTPATFNPHVLQPGLTSPPSPRSHHA